VNDTTLKSLRLTFTFNLNSTIKEDHKLNSTYKRDDFTFPIVNFPFISSNIPKAPAYGVDISQLIRYSRACAQYRTELSYWRKSYSNKAMLENDILYKIPKTGSNPLLILE